MEQKTGPNWKTIKMFNLLSIPCYMNENLPGGTQNIFSVVFSLRLLGKLAVALKVHEKVLYCFYKTILKITRESKTSQPCLHTLI